MTGGCSSRELALLRYLDHVSSRFLSDHGFPWVGSCPDTVTPQMRDEFGIAGGDFSLGPSLAARGLVEETLPGRWNPTAAGRAAARFADVSVAVGTVH